MLEIKNSAKEVKNTFERLMNRLTEHDWRKTELKGIAIETFKTKKQTRKKQNRIPKNCGTTMKDVTYM